MTTTNSLIPFSPQQETRYRGKDAFGILGVPPTAGNEEVRRAYLKLARCYHPDLNSSPGAEEQFIRVTRAYNEIMTGGDLLRLKTRCKAVGIKAVYSDQLHMSLRIKVLTGIDPPVAVPSDGGQGEVSGKMLRLSYYMTMICPFCRRREMCDRVTGFGEVEMWHWEIQARVFGNTKKGA